jgi:hypothetical protein
MRALARVSTSKSWSERMKDQLEEFVGDFH